MDIFYDLLEKSARKDLPKNSGSPGSKFRFRCDNLTDARQFLIHLQSSGGISIEAGAPRVHDDFNWSHVLVHNGGSFTIEYLASLKPALYLTENSVVAPNFNALGSLALGLHYQCNTLGELEQELVKISNGHDPMREARKVFWFRILSRSLGFEDHASGYVLNI